MGGGQGWDVVAVWAVPVVEQRGGALESATSREPIGTLERSSSASQSTRMMPFRLVLKLREIIQIHSVCRLCDQYVLGGLP